MTLEELVQNLPDTLLIPITSEQSAINLYLDTPGFTSFGIVSINIAINNERLKRNLELIDWYDTVFNDEFFKNIS